MASSAKRVIKIVSGEIRLLRGQAGKLAIQKATVIGRSLQTEPVIASAISSLQAGGRQFDPGHVHQSSPKGGNRCELRKLGAYRISEP